MQNNHLISVLCAPLFLLGITLVQAQTAIMQNNAPYTITCMAISGHEPVDQNGDPELMAWTDFAPTQQFNFAMDGMGQVMKCGRSGDVSNIVQMEWSVNPSFGHTTWDMSFVNSQDQGGNQPFKDDGWMVKISAVDDNGVNINGDDPTGSGEPKCWNSWCPAPENCLDPNQVYLTPDSDHGDPSDNPVRTCPLATSLTWTIGGISDDQEPEAYKAHIQQLDQNPTRLRRLSHRRA